MGAVMPERTADYSDVLRTLPWRSKLSQPPQNDAEHDPYRQRFEAALCRLNLPAGLRLWMQRAHPDLDLQEQGLFSLAARLWQEHAPLEQFESVLSEWLSCFRLAESFYSEETQTRKELPE